jgi:DNA-binding MarR family transcriptional regulator
VELKCGKLRMKTSKIKNQPLCQALFEELFENSIPKRLILQIYNNHNQIRKNYIARLSREIGCTQHSCIPIVKKFIELGLITRIKHERRYIITLTDKGREVSRKLAEINGILEMK